MSQNTVDTRENREHGQVKRRLFLFYNNNNNNNYYYYYYLLKLVCYPVAVVILHVNKT
jgi:hypothetical protein